MFLEEIAEDGRGGGSWADRGWDPYVCYLLNCTLALMTDFESSRCVITTRQEAGCSGKVERELKPMVR